MSDNINENKEIEEQVGASNSEELQVEENKVKIISPGQMVLKRFFRSRLSVIGLVTLIVLFAFSFLGPFLVPWGESESDESWGEPTEMDIPSPAFANRIDDKILIKDIIVSFVAEGDLVKPFSPSDTPAQLSEKISANLPALLKEYTTNGPLEYTFTNLSREEESTFLEVELKTGSYAIYHLEYNDEDETYSRVYNTVITRSTSVRETNLNASPSWRHLLGTDGSGYDVFVRLMYAGRISLTLGFVTIFIQMVLGVLLGGIAGYFGKWIDSIIMRIIDIIYCLPTMPILLIFSAVLDGMEIAESLKIYYLMGMLALMGWAGIARTVRGQILFLREQEYMVAAEALGIGVPRRIVKHLVPNVMPILIVQATMGLGGIILTESTLSWLGLGIKAPAAAWGTMINGASDPIILQFYVNQWIPAGVLIVLAVLAFNFVGDGLRDAFDPKMRR